MLAHILYLTDSCGFSKRTWFPGDLELCGHFISDYPQDNLEIFIYNSHFSILTAHGGVGRGVWGVCEGWGGVPLCVGHKNTNVPLILSVQIIFLFEANLQWGISGIFQGGLNVFYLQISLRYAQENLGVQMVSAPSKIYRNAPLYVKKINLYDFQNQRYINS